MSDVMVRRPVPGEGAAIARVHIGAWREGYASLMPASFLADLDETERGEAWDLRLLAHERALPEAAGHEFLVADHQPDPAVPAVLAGVATLGHERRPAIGEARSRPIAAEAGPTGEVWMINVLPSLWRSGVGSALLSAADNRLDELRFESKVLWVLDGNDRARAFYERHGWSFDGAEKLEAFGGRELRELRYRRAATAPGGGSASLM